MRVLHDDCRLGRQERRHDVAEVPCIRPERNGRTVGRRLDHILAAATAEAAADEGDRRCAPPGAEFADRVDEQDRPAMRRAWPSAPGSAGGRIASSLRRCQGMPESSSNFATASNRSGCRGTRISRNCGCCGDKRRKISTAICSSGSCVLPARKTMSSSAMPASWRSATVRELWRSVCAPSYFSEPVTSHAIGRCAERPKSLGRLVVLCRDEIDLRKQPRR